MRILALETTTAILSVAVCEEDRVLAETVVDCGRTHTERLPATIDWVLREARCGLESLGALAVSVGPGSFTGVRVGIAALKGLALGSRLPLVGVPTLDAMTRLGAFHDGLVCPVLDAKMGEVFGAVYRFEAGTRTKLTDDRVCPVERLFTDLGEPVTVLGDGAPLYRERIGQAAPRARFAAGLGNAPRAAAVAAEGLALLAAGADTDAGAVRPVYLRKSQAEEARDARLAKAHSP